MKAKCIFVYVQIYIYTQTYIYVHIYIYNREVLVFVVSPRVLNALEGIASDS